MGRRHGYYRLGEAWEQAGEFQEAANAFASLAAGYPTIVFGGCPHAKALI